MGLFCNVQHPSGHGMALSQSWASTAESVSHSSFQSFPSMSCAQLGTAFAFVDILHAWMWNCSPAQGRENLLGTPLPFPHSSCCVLWEEGNWGLEHILGTLITPQSPQ